MEYYKYSKWCNSIMKVEVEKETEKCVWLYGSKTNKITNYDCYFKTYEEALGYKREYIKEMIDFNLNKLRYYEKEYNKYCKLLIEIDEITN